MKIALIGYGSMGQEVEKIASLKGIEIASIHDIDNPLRQDLNYDFDVAIDFSLPDCVLENVSILAEHGKNIVIGTTGWKKFEAKVFEICSRSGIGMVYGSNFSLGMQIFGKLIDLGAELINKFDEYDVFISEIHHRRKTDSPSGTALSLAQKLLSAIERKSEIETETSHSIIEPKKLHLSSLRGGEIAGTHTVYFDSDADTIELTHRAKNRSGFARGALLAAEWISGKQGIWKFDDIFNELINITK
jgi:4-hydroxy-tetrahydrodipicolinate reductase